MMATDMPSPAACMNLRIGFAGAIRAGDVSQQLQEQLASIYAAVALAFETVATKAVSGETILDLHAKALPECEARCAMTLLTGYAEGADRISAAAWRTLGLGGIHAVFPFASTDRTDEDTAWTHRPPENQDKADSYRVDLIEPGRPFAKRFE